MSIFFENNNVCVSGKLISEFEYSHEMFGEKFYVANLCVERLSEKSDIIPISVSERLVDIKERWLGQFVKVIGQLRTYNKNKSGKRKLVINVFAREFEVLDFVENGFNEIHLDGYICKSPNYRKTPLEREISDVLLAVNRCYGKSDYIPCIFWGRNAIFASGLDVGTHIKVNGRFQSREYIKKFEDGTHETITAYEVSVYKMEVVEDMED